MQPHRPVAVGVSVPGDRVIGCRHLTPSTHRLGVSVRPTPIWMPGGVSLVLGAVLVGAAGGGGRGGVHRQWQGRAWGLSLPGRVGQRRGELMHPIAQSGAVGVSVPVTGS